MIRNLKLRDWRNYEDASIELQAGTTFVVASNGVGKTSLAEAARWALFGTPPASSSSPVRVGADKATAIVELVLPTRQVVTVERTLAAKPTRQPVQPSIDLDGRRIDLEEFERALRDAYGTDHAFLARLTMPAASRDQDTPAALGLEGHLGQYFGVDGLQRAIALLATELKSTEKQIRQIKVANASTAQQLAELEAAVTTATAAVQEAAEAHSAAQADHDALRARLQAGQLREAWKERRRQWSSQTSELLEEIAGEFEEPVDRMAVEQRITSRIDELSRALENARVQIGIGESRTATIRANQASLDEAHDDCPVCRRPLDGTTIALAHDANETELEALSTELAAARQEELAATTQRSQMQSFLQRWRSIPDPGPEPEATVEATPTDVDIEAAASKVSEAFERLVSARAGQVDAERRLREAREADDAMNQLETLFRDEAEVRVALDTTRATLDELLDQTVRPLATEVDQRWKGLFPNRGSLTTRADGSITRNINGHPLPYDAFSTGESMGTTIVLRLLVAQMATTANFCWFDEPLEHLDPDVRRQVANILSRASDGDSQLRQIVVTTYEEPLARHLQARNPERVHIIDVRQAPTPDQD